MLNINPYPNCRVGKHAFYYLRKITKVRKGNNTRFQVCTVCQRCGIVIEDSIHNTYILAEKLINSNPQPVFPH